MSKKKNLCCCSWCTPIVVITLLVCTAVIVTVLGAASIPLFDDLYQQKVKENLVLKKGSESYNNWVSPPAPVYMQFYIFNYTNAQEFLKNNTKPRVVERGPYSYREYRVNEVLEETEDTITYLENNTFVFDPATSCEGCTENDTFIVPNIAIITVFKHIKDLNITNPGWFETLAIKAANVIFNADKDVSLFLELTTYKLIWGYSNGFLGRLKTIEDALSIFHLDLPPLDPWVALSYNGTIGALHDGNMTLYNGKEDINEVQRIFKWRGIDKAPYWRTEYGEMLNGTDGSRFHPDLKRTDKIYVFTAEICRSLYLEYDKDDSVFDIDLYRYTTTDLLFANHTINPDNYAFCGPDKCWGTGILPLGQCQEGGPPVFMSAPHFYQGDPSLYDAIDGLHPEKEKHATFVSVEPVTGLAMSAHKRLQINVLAQPSEWFDVMKPLKEEYNFLPVLWVNEGATIDRPNADKYKSEVVQPKIVLKWVSIGLMILGGLVLIAALVVGLVVKNNPEYKKFENEPDSHSKSETNGAVVT